MTYRNSIIAALLLAALAPSAAAESVVPKPKLRPAQPPSSESAPQREAAAPIPRLRPARGAADETPPDKQTGKETPKDTPAAEQPAPAPGGGWSAASVAAARAECTRLLAGLSLEQEALEPLGDEGGCGAPAPVLVSRVAGVAVTPKATLTCDMAAALHGWVTGTVQPAARKRLGTEVTEIRSATSYACRRRNNSSFGKMSEHSKANALDMAGFSFAKKTDVSVGGSGSWGEGLSGAFGLSKDGSFLDDIRQGACTHFTTVLGPGSDPYHGDHFHVDVLRRKGDYRICQ